MTVVFAWWTHHLLRGRVKQSELLYLIIILYGEFDLYKKFLVLIYRLLGIVTKLMWHRHAPVKWLSKKEINNISYKPALNMHKNWRDCLCFLICTDGEKGGNFYVSPPCRCRLIVIHATHSHVCTYVCLLSL